MRLPESGMPKITEPRKFAGDLCATLACPGGSMAKLALIYGMRLLPEDDLGEVRDATVVLKNGRSARVTMHLIEGSKEEIEATFRQSIEAFFEMYPEI